MWLRVRGAGAVSTVELPDIQHSLPLHVIPINWVGIRGLRYPMHLDIAPAPQQTIGEFSLAVALVAEERGTHMSRFVEELAATRSGISPRSLLASAERLAGRLASESARIDVSFPFFLEREAPVSEATAPVDYQGSMGAVVRPDGPALTMSARVPVTSLCPCSKEISDYGAHSQRGYVSIEASATGSSVDDLLAVDLTYLVEVAERAASAPIYSLLKRTDERHVTMQAYDQPAFVEDVVRAVAADLASDRRISSFCVDVENQESIHNHSAWASIS
jgi:GTP cyclohydrolase I